VPAYTLDASVFVNAFVPAEQGHAESRRLLEELRDQAAPVVVPTLAFTEIAAAVARGQDDSELARRFAQQVARLPHLIAVALDSQLAQQAAALAARYRLRGADAVYVAVAHRFGSVLVTRDEEQLLRSKEAVRALRPGEVELPG
jgi:predicted nucleic acid-binding protein